MGAADALVLPTASLVTRAMDYHPLEVSQLAEKFFFSHFTPIRLRRMIFSITYLRRSQNDDQLEAVSDVALEPPGRISIPGAIRLPTSGKSGAVSLVLLLQLSAWNLCDAE